MSTPRNNSQRDQGQTNQGGGTLRTLSLKKIDGQWRWVDTVIDLDRILHMSACPNDDYPDTSLLQYSSQYALHVDVPLKQMRKIPPLLFA